MRKLLALLTLLSGLGLAQIQTLPPGGAAGGGDITGVTAGDGISGGGATGGVTVTNAAPLYGCTDTGGDDTYVCAPAGFPSSYSTGITLRITFTTTNTGAATIDAGPGAKAIKLPGGSSNPANGDIVALKPMLVTYDSTADGGSGAWILAVGGSGGVGDVVGPASATDNCAALFDGTDGKLLQDSPICYDVTKNGADYLQGSTSGGLAFSVANVAGTANTLIWPADTNAAAEDTVLVLGAVITCPTNIPSGLPSTCRQLSWSARGGGTSSFKQAIDAVGGTVAAPFLLWNTLAAAAPTPTCVEGTTETTLLDCYATFPDSDGNYSMQVRFMLPSDWTGAIDLKFKWKAAATSGDVVWQATLVCRADGEIADAAFNSANTVTDTAKGTTLQLNDASITGMTTTGCAAGELATLKVFRNRTNGSDTISGTVLLEGVEVTMRRLQ